MTFFLWSSTEARLAFFLSKLNPPLKISSSSTASCILQWLLMKFGPSLYKLGENKNIAIIHIQRSPTSSPGVCSQHFTLIFTIYLDYHYSVELSTQLTGWPTVLYVDELVKFKDDLRSHLFPARWFSYYTHDYLCFILFICEVYTVK